jgi:putative ABC transport system permease protein
MGFWKEIGRRTLHLGRRSRFESELTDEIRFHIDTRVEELEKSGWTRSDALRQAHREFGSHTRVREDSRAAWQFSWLEDLVADLKHAARSFRRSSAFSLTAIVCLALGIGANALIFSLVNAILLKSLPFPDADRLVMLRFSPPQQPDQKLGMNAGSYFFIREHNKSFERMGAVRLTPFSIAVEGSESREWLMGGWITPGLAETMGVNPMIGRWFSQEDTSRTIVISHGLWQRAFGGSPDVLGKKLQIDTLLATVVGVMPPGYQTLNPDIDLWAFQSDQNLANALRSPNRVFNIFARLKPGVTVAQAQSDLDRIAGPLGEELEMNRGWALSADTLRDAYVGHLRTPLLVFQGAVVMLLVIACANVGGLMLAQAAARQKELALRSALGSSRRRAIRQLLTESVLLSLMGGLFGVGLGWVGLRIATSLVPTVVPPSGLVNLDLAVIGFTFGLSILTGLVFGVLPAIQASRPDVMDVLRESTRITTLSGGRQRLRGAFVVTQVALSLVLLIGAGLLTHSLMRLNLVHSGFDPQGLATFQVPFSRSLYRNAGGNTPTGGLLVEMTPRLNVLIQQIHERLASLPGVESVAVAMTPPLGGVPRRINFARPGQPLSASEQEAWNGEWYPIGAGYFRTLKIPIVRGREFETADSETSRPVVIINNALAQRFFGGEDPIGKQIQSSHLFDPPREIVGVVGDVRQDRYQLAPSPQMYLPRSQLPAKMDMTVSFEVLVATFIIRTNSSLGVLAPTFRQVVAEVDRNHAVTNVLTIEQYAAAQLQDLRHYAMLLGIFGGISVLLSFVGLFGVMANNVNQRRNEIGIRVALGATSSTILSLVAKQGLVLIGIGMTFGLIASLALTRAIARFLWGVTATDPLTFFIVMAALAIVALIACYLPARRALRIDPMVALRPE